MNSVQPTRLPLPRLLAYASINIPLAAIGLPVAVFLAPLYAEEVGLGLATTGIIFMLLRGWDIFTDPIMGYLVDRYQTRWGRVRHWIVLCVPILAISAWFLYWPTQNTGAFYLAGWMAVFYLGFTLLQTSQQAWAPAIAQDYDERTRLFQWREIFNIVTLVSLLALPDILSRFVEMNRFQEVAIMGAVLIFSLPIVVGLAVSFVPDPPLQGHAGTRPDFSPAALRSALHNSVLWRILIIEVCVGLAVSATGANYLFLSEYAFGIEGGASSALILVFITGFITLPAWMWYSRRTEKHIALRAVLIATAIAYLSLLGFAQIGGLLALTVGMIMCGLGFATPFALVRSMLADLIDEELARTGENRSGFYYSLMTSAYKTGAGLAIGITYPLIGIVVGFDPNADNTPGQILGFQIVFVAVPFLAYLLAALAAWNHPITRDVQAATRETLAARATATPGP